MRTNTKLFTTLHHLWPLIWSNEFGCDMSRKSNYGLRPLAQRCLGSGATMGIQSHQQLSAAGQTLIIRLSRNWTIFPECSWFRFGPWGGERRWRAFGAGAKILPIIWNTVKKWIEITQWFTGEKKILTNECKKVTSVSAWFMQNTHKWDMCA